MICHGFYDYNVLKRLGEHAFTISVVCDILQIFPNPTDDNPKTLDNMPKCEFCGSIYDLDILVFKPDPDNLDYPYFQMLNNMIPYYIVTVCQTHFLRYVGIDNVPFFPYLIRNIKNPFSNMIEDYLHKIRGGLINQ